MGCCNNKDTEDLRTERRSIISVNKFDTVHKSIFFNLKCENQFFFLDCMIHIKKGEIMKEKSDCLFLATD